jgi:hypothetical protein
LSTSTTSIGSTSPGAAIRNVRPQWPTITSAGAERL